MASRFCPRCTQGISQERRLSAIVVCNSCGFVVSNSETKSHQATDRRFIAMTSALCLILAAAFAQVCVWDRHAWEIVPLKFRELIGSNSQKDLERMTEICLERQRVSCVEKSYQRLGEHDKDQLLKLAQFEMNHNRYRQAIDAYRSFFLKGGSDLKASYLFARALSQMGKKDEAAKYYDYILRARPDQLLQAAAVDSYVHLLIDDQRPEQAKQAVEKIGQFSKIAANMMNEELNHLTGRTQPQRGTASVGDGVAGTSN